MRFKLRPFRSCSWVEELSGQINLADAAVHISYALKGDLSNILLPQEEPSQRKDELWRTTCFEFFWRQPDEQSYVEVNLAPAGHWNCYGFTNTRTGMHQSDVFSLQSIQQRRGADHFMLDAVMKFNGKALQPAVFGVSSVIAHGNNVSYFSLEHGDKPDFHNSIYHSLRM